MNATCQTCAAPSSPRLPCPLSTPASPQAEGDAQAEVGGQWLAGGPEVVHHGCTALALPSPHASTETLYGRCADLIRTKGDEQLTVEQLTQEITPRGRGETPATHKPTQAWPMSLCTGAHPSFASDAATVPDEVKAELLLRIRRFVEEQAV